MKGFKAFNPDFTCNGKQYQEDTVFEEERAEICECGMHFCKNPFDVLDYYDLVNPNGEFNEFAPVEALSETKTDDDKKFCTTKLKIGVKLGFPGFVKACVDFIIEKTKFESSDNSDCGDNGARIGSSGNWAQIGSSGYRAQIGSSGYRAQIGSSGDGAQIGSSGDGARIGSSGNWAQIGSSGYRAQIGSSGNWAQIGSTGDGAQIGSSGNWAQIGSTGDGAQIGSSGDGAQIGSSGNWAQIGSTGYDSVVMCAGSNCMAKAKKGSWITLAEWKYSAEKDRIVPVCVKTEQVDGVTIKEDTFYKLEKGAFVEVEM